MPLCEGFTCPNNDQEGGLFALGCSPDFCDCSFGQLFSLKSIVCFPIFYSRCSLPQALRGSQSSSIFPRVGSSVWLVLQHVRGMRWRVSSLQIIEYLRQNCIYVLLHPLKYISQCNIESKISSHRGGLTTPIPHHINPSDKVVTKLNLDELRTNCVFG